MEGDRRGEYTFVSKLGKSVIDYVCVEWNMMHRVKKFFPSPVKVTFCQLRGIDS